MAASKTIGGINVTISATIDKFRKNLTVARRLLTGFTSSIKNAIFSLKGLTAALSVGAFAKFTADAFGELDALADSADKLNITTDALAGFRIAADQAGVPLATLEKALVTLGTKSGKRADVALFDLMDKSSKLATEQERLALAVKTFGARGASMVNMLRMTRPEMEALVKFTNDVGYGMSGPVAAGVGRAVDAFGKLKIAVKGVFFTIAAELAPYIEVLSNKLTGLLAAGGAAKGIGRGIADAIVTATKFIADAIQMMVQGVLNFLQRAEGLLIQFRDSAGAKAFGMGFSGDADRKASFARFDEARKRYGRSLRWSLPSTGIDSAVANARMQSELAGQAKTTGGTGSMSALFKGLLGNASGNLMNGPLAQTFKLEAAKMMLGLKGTLWGNQNGMKPAKPGGGLQSMSAQDPLSREGNAQRVRSLAQSQKFAEKQLKEQQRGNGILVKIEQKLMPAQNANLG